MFDILEEELKDSRLKFYSGEITRYGIVSLPIHDTSVHVYMPYDFTWREFPKEDITKEKVYFEKKVRLEKDYDFLLTNLSADGIFLSEKARSILEKFKIGVHKYYPYELVIRKQNFLRKEFTKNYFWLHLIFDETRDNFVDFSKTIFKEEVWNHGDIIEINELKYISLYEWYIDKKAKHDKWLRNPDKENFYEIKPIKIHLNEQNELPDVLNFGRIGPSEIFFSKKLIDEIIKNGLKGINIYNTNLIAQ